MNHVWPVAIRSGGLCLLTASCPQRSIPLRRLLSFAAKQCTRSQVIAPLRPNRIKRVPSSSIRCFSHTTRADFVQSFARRKLVAYKPAVKEQGLSFQNGDLSDREIKTIFGQDAPPTRLTNQLLRVLHGRRVDGTLDLPLPEEFDATLRKYPSVTADGLQWLREKFPFDEDEAIIQRIEREEALQEKQNPSDLLRRGEQLGLYKPQSGNYQAPLSKTEGDVFGVSQIEKRQAKNIEKAEQEEEELQQEIDKIQEEVKEKYGELAVRPGNSLETSDGVRPPNSYEKWILRSKMRATSKLTLEAPEVTEKSQLRRLLPSFLFVAFVTSLCYLYAVTWIPPKRSERMFPDVGLSFATISGLIATNFFIYALWKWPPAWRVLNRYFITVPGMPVPISMLGNVFSHQTIKHITINMAWLLILGMSLHEDIGRGNFLGVYIAGGAVGSFVSASSYVLRGILFTSHLGASGGVAAVIAAYCTLHASDRFTFFLIPADWQDTISFTGIQFFSGMMIWEALQFLSIRYFTKYRTTDFAAHFGGYAVGIIAAWWFGQDKEREQHRKSRVKLTWVDHLIARKAADGKSSFQGPEK